jgi:hypothetical protein
MEWGVLTVGSRDVIFMATKAQDMFNNINNLISKENEAKQNILKQKEHVYFKQLKKFKQSQLSLS